MVRQPESNVVDTVVQLLCEPGHSQVAGAVRTMLNEAMRIERSRAIEAETLQAYRTPDAASRGGAGD